MANILSVSASAPFSTSSLDASSAASDELDPRFVEELQGAMGLVEQESAPQSAAQDVPSSEVDSSKDDPAVSLQNLPLMPWSLIQAPANFAPPEVPSAGGSSELPAVSTLGAASAAGMNVDHLAALSVTPGLVTAGGAVGVLEGADVVSTGAVAASPDGTQGDIDQAQRAVVAPGSQGSVVSGGTVLAPVSDEGLSQPQDRALQPSVVDSMQAHSPASTVTQMQTVVTSQVAAAPISALQITPGAGVASMPTPSQLPSQQGTDAASGAETKAQPSVVAALAPAVSHDQIELSSLSGDAGVPAQALTVHDDASVAVSQGVMHDQMPAPAVSKLASAAEPQVDAATQRTEIDVTSASPVTKTLASASSTLSPTGAQGRTSSESDATAEAQASAERAALSAATSAGASVAATSAQQVASATTQANVAVAAAGGSVGAAQTEVVSPGAQYLDDREEALVQAAQERSNTPRLDVPAATPSTSTVAAVSDTESTYATSPNEATQTESAAANAFTLTSAAAHNGQVESVRGHDAGAQVTSVKADAPATSALTFNGATPDALGAGASARAGGSAESTFASSFVQALMGHVHPPVAPHSQALEVIPAPAPLAPHQVRFDAGQVQVEVVRLVKQGGGQVVMELTPPDESKFKIDLSINQQGVARLVVDGASESTRLRLEQTVSGLQDQFQQMGLQLQLDMRQPRQHEAQTQPDAFTTPDAPGSTTIAGRDTVDMPPVTGRPTWEQGQVYLVA